MTKKDFELLQQGLPPVSDEVLECLTIHNYDFLALDEVETLQFAKEEEILGAFKNYLENGRIVVGNYKGMSDCGLMLLGNIKLDRHLRPKNSDYFLNLPSFFHSSALIDRIHGFIEGWELFRFNEDLKVKGIALNTEYFSEILHLLRTSSHYSDIIDQCLDIPSSADTSDTKAVKKMCCAYLKLLYPHVQNPNDIPKSEFVSYILNPAMQKRAIIRKQLSEIDQEFLPDMPDIKNLDS
jgi:ATP-dependent Lon protease